MDDDMGAVIIQHLDAVRRERERRQVDVHLLQRVLALKAYQQERFRRTYPDLLESERYQPAALFFLQELYGPDDFTQRDEQFARIVGPLVRLFPREILRTVERLTGLHALSERLDTDMACHGPQPGWSRRDYVQAWQAVGCRDDRHQQIELLLDVGSAMDRLTRNPLLRHSLRAMRGPAKSAGLGDLQSFLEAGFDIFKRMRGASEFLSLVRSREETLCARLFASDALPVAPSPVADHPLGQLP
jgi:hypothetical protein